jgi:hypothetical protein
MSLKPEGINPVPEETARIAHAAYAKGNVFMHMRDELGRIYRDESFADLFSHTGQPAEAPWRLALVTIMQFAQGLSDQQAADAVRGRIDFARSSGHGVAPFPLHRSRKDAFSAPSYRCRHEYRSVDALARWRASCSNQTLTFRSIASPGRLIALKSSPAVSEVGQNQKASVMTDIVARYVKRKRLFQIRVGMQTGMHFEAFYASWISL